jgi:3-carboxy-cis,cis-muconate cycloisomerase
MLFSPLFLQDRLRDAVAEAAWIQAMLDAEAALVRAEAQAGVIPMAAAEEIVRCCLAECFDPETIGVEARTIGNPAEPLVRALRRPIPESAARYVHHGATSQDILDTAGMLIVKRALALIEPALTRLGAGLAYLAEEHRDTLMVGRTFLQQALPITFGLKAAGWLAGATRAQAGLQLLHDDCLAVELGGAAGTLAVLGDTGIAVLREFAQLLQLAEPDLPWHSERSRLAQIGAALSQTAGTLDKTALDIALLAQTESSSMAQEHERGVGTWQAEWQALSGALAFTGGAAMWLGEVVAGLEVDPVRMRAHLDDSHGLVMAERVALLLGERIGRDEAHQLIRAASGRATAGKGTFRAVLLADDEVRRYLSVEEIDAAMDSTTYLGATHRFIDRALARHRLSDGSRLEG